MLEGSSYSGNIDWNNIVKKEARGINNEALGEVQEVTQDYVLVERGVINKEKFYIPREYAVGYNGTILIFKISAEEAKNKFLRDSPPMFLTSQFTGKDAAITDDLTIVPIMAERLDVNKKESSQEAKIIKEPISEIKTVDVRLAHDELYIETRSIGNKNEQQAVNLPIYSDIPEQE
jgi:stress response protein YsnF